MRIAMTGPTGAIGTALIEACMLRGIEVLVLTRSDSPRNRQIPQGPGVEIVPCDLKDLHTVKSGQACTAFFHMGWAGTTGPGRNDMHLQNQNVAWALDAVELAHRLHCGTFVFVGSQAEYGRTDVPLTPTTPTFPENGYGIGKLCAGQMTRCLAHSLGMRHVWPRILSVYGPRDGTQNLIMALMVSLARHEVPAATAGEQVWSFLYSMDAAEGLLALAERGRDGQIYPMGGKEQASLRTFLETEQRIVWPEGRIDFGALPYREGQVMHLSADLTAIQRDTEWIPKVSFEEGIRRTWAWYQPQAL